MSALLSLSALSCSAVAEVVSVFYGLQQCQNYAATTMMACARRRDVVDKLPGHGDPPDNS